MSAVSAAMVAGLALYAYQQMRRPSTVKAESAYECNEKYCPPFYQIHVDPAVHTNLRDDRTPWHLKTGTLPCEECGMAKSTTYMNLKGVYEASKAVFREETINHPGVQLVAHAIG